MKTTSYEISKKLKEAGFDAEGDFGYRVPDSLNDLKAYDLETILDALPKKIGEHYLAVEFDPSDFCIGYDGFYIAFMNKNESLADTAGRMWLMLKEKGIIC